MSLVKKVHRGLCLWHAARIAILVEPHVFSIHSIQFGIQEVIDHVSVELTIDGGRGTIFIFKAVWADYSARPKSASNSHFSGCNGFWCISCGLVSAQLRQFCLLTYPFNQKWASSLKIINSTPKHWVNFQVL